MRLGAEKKPLSVGTINLSFKLPSEDLLRDMFDNFAKKASSVIKDSDKDLKSKVEDFFKKDLRCYHESLSTIAQKIEKGNIGSDEAENKIAALTNELLLKGDSLSKKVNNDLYMKTIKKVFREIAGFWFYKSPIVKMANDRPRGYPGDYILFDILYDNKPLAKANTIEFCFDKYFLNNDYAKAARARKNKMKNILQDLIENSELSTIKLLNVACGPSREIRELLTDPYLASRKKLIFTGLDSDEESLKFSKSKLSNLPSSIQTRFIHENVLSLIRDDKYYDVIGKQDMIYILGLTEYLPDGIFTKLTHFLFELLNDKGMLVITYKDKDISFPSLPPEWFCDWAFIKRSKDDLLNMTKELGSGRYSLKIEREGTGTIFFLILTKK